MARIDLRNKVIQAKLVYYGPGLCGKTTNLEFVNKHLTKGQELMSLATAGDRTIFFDFMPLELGKLRGMNVQFKLYTVPGQVRYNETRKMVLKNVDGIVFVADSQELMMDANLESFENMFTNLSELGIDANDTTIVLQYNKRDLPNVLSPEALDKALNPQNFTRFLASAMTGEGVVETLKAACSLTLNQLAVQLPEREEAPGDAARSQPGTAPAAGAESQGKRPNGKRRPSPAAGAPAAVVSQGGASTAGADAAMPPPEYTGAIHSLLSESGRLHDSLKEQLSTMRDLSTRARESSEALKLLSNGAVKKSDLAALGQRLDAAMQTQRLQRLEKRFDELGPLLEKLASLHDRVSELGTGSKAEVPTKADFSELERRVRALPTRIEVEKLSRTAMGHLEERVKHDEQVLSALRDSKTTQTASGAASVTGDVATRADVARLEQLLTKLPSQLNERESSSAATKEDLAKLEQRLVELAERMASHEPKDVVHQADLVKVEQRLSGMQDLRKLSQIAEQLAAAVPRLATVEQLTQVKATIAELKSGQMAVSAAGGANEGATRPDMKVTRKMRAVTAKSWPPHRPAHEMKETIRPSGTYPFPEAAGPSPSEPDAAEAEKPAEVETSEAAETQEESPPVEADATAESTEAELEAAAEESVDSATGDSDNASGEHPVAQAADGEAQAEAETTEAEPEEAEAHAQPEPEEEPEPEEDSATEEADAESEPEQSADDAEAAEADASSEPPDNPEHKNAARVARVMLADLYLYHKEDVEEGIRNDDFFDRNAEALTDMRATYESRVPEEIRSQFDHFEKAARDFIERKRKQLGDA